jgi:hypothetical protein
MYVPVISTDGRPLMPTIPSRARRWIKAGRATPFFKKGVFCIRMNEPVGTEVQPIAVGLDPGSKWEGFSIKSAKHTFLNLHVDATTWVSDAITTRREMRRARRFRNTPCRQNRMNRARGSLPPSTKARWQWKLRLARWLSRIFPATWFVVEDIKVRTRPGRHPSARHWNVNFSPLEVGKNWFYDELRKIALVELRTDTAELRDQFGLKKAKQKSAKVFESHCVDSWVLANAQVGGHTAPDNTRLLYVVPLRWHRRQLHAFQPSSGNIRRFYGGTRSLGFKRGALVLHPKWGLSFVGGTMKGRISLHSIATGQRLTQNVRPAECRIRSPYNSWRTRLLPVVNSGVPGAQASRWMEGRIDALALSLNGAQGSAMTGLHDDHPTTRILTPR